MAAVNGRVQRRASSPVTTHWTPGIVTAFLGWPDHIKIAPIDEASATRRNGPNLPIGYPIGSVHTRACRKSPRTPAHHDRVRTRLSAGGRRIQTIGPAKAAIAILAA
jgi:hypothetical protein